MEISIYFHAMPVSKEAKEIDVICKKYGGEFQSGGTCFDDEGIPCRDVQYKILKKNSKNCQKELVEAGYKDVKLG